MSDEKATHSNTFFSSYQNTYTSIPGSQIKALWAGRDLGTLQGITVSISAEKSPIYVMGFQTCRGYTTNKIGIAGSAVFLNIDRDALWDQRTDDRNKIVSASRTTLSASGKAGGDPPATQLSVPGEVAPTEQNIAKVDSAVTSIPDSSRSKLTKESPLYAAQLREFDVVLTGFDFEGRGAYKAVRGVELINEGFATSIDDTILESQFTFVAREVTPWIPNSEDVMLDATTSENVDFSVSGA